MDEESKKGKCSNNGKAACVERIARADNQS
jgi:hypothetical protein